MNPPFTLLRSAATAGFGHVHDGHTPGRAIRQPDSGLATIGSRTVARVTEVRRGCVLQDGHSLRFTEAGPADGAPVVLLHGLMSDSSTWDRAIGPLAAHGLRVIAPDLLGHGASDKPSAHYSLEFFASSLSQLLTALTVPGATVAGHSLGGAIAMQFGHDYPEQLHRLVLVSSGGLGREVHLVLRAATIPGARHVVRAMLNERTAPVYRAPRLHRSLRLRPDAVVNLGRMGRALISPDGRSAFFTAARSVMHPFGQRGSMIDMGYLAASVPTLIVWSEQDAIIPVSHAYAAHRHLPGSRLALYPGMSHEPHRRHAQRFADEVAHFVRTTGGEHPT
jgi:pimeloyl-ACP methyl ester carboxylesterase